MQKRQLSGKKILRHRISAKEGICILTVLLFWFAIWEFTLPHPLFQDDYSTVLRASHGQLLGAKVTTDGQWRFAASDSLPSKITQALIIAEDKRFYYHPGVDPLAILRALKQNISQQRIVSGGSTITMQVVRLMRHSRPRTLLEKIKECGLALLLETHYSKAEILSLYASHAPFGGNTVGIDAAAWRYFGRDAFDLSWAESAMLAVLPNAPSLIHPGKNRPLLLSKRNRLLEKLYHAGDITADEWTVAVREPIPEKPIPMPTLAPHALARSPSGRQNRSTIDIALQQRITEIAQEKAQTFATNQIHNLCILVAEVATGNILAYVGNTPQTDEIYSPAVDIITAPRSSGSILKPLLYAAMMEEGSITPYTLIPDIPFYYKGFSPQNFNKTYDGAVPAHRVLERSLNVPSAKMLQQYGYERFHALLRQLGVNTLTQPADHYGLSLILGGAECTLWDMVSVYAGMAYTLNQATTYTELPSISAQNATSPSIPSRNAITSTNLETSYNLSLFPHTSSSPRISSDYPFSTGAIWLTFDALSQVYRPEEEAGWQSFASSRTIAWKTGTSFGNRDAWSIGITPEYVVGVWVGNASGEGRPALTGIHYAAPVLFDVFNALPATTWFATPYQDLEEVEICDQSGYLKGPFCISSTLRLVSRNCRHSAICPYHEEITVNADTSYRVNTLVLPIEKIHRISWFVLPPTEAWYYRQRNSDYKPLPPIHPLAISAYSDHPIDIVYPQDGSTVILTRQTDGKKGKLIIRATHSSPDATLYYHLNNRYIGSTHTEHKLTIDPESGPCTLTIVDEDGFRATSRFNIN